MSKISRRKFIKLAGSSAALSTVNVLGKSAAFGDIPNASLNSLDKFEHVVVLMLENRSFDNVLGFLYAENGLAGQKFEGVAGKKLSNPIPPDAEDAHYKEVPVTQGHTMDNPNPDPGEEYPHVNTQLFGSVIPASNRGKDIPEMTAPYNLPDTPLPEPSMKGFVADYINNYRFLMKKNPTYEQYRVIMECFPPDGVPVLTTLAREFAVFDHWHCAVPSQTFCNRSFFHAASSSGLVINSPYSNWASGNQAETLFNRMEKSKRSWKVYFDREDVFSLTCLIHYQQLRKYFRSNFCLMQQFFEDAASGNLPQYSFIEPRLFYRHNDMHPPFEVGGKTLPSSVLAGEILLNEIYNAIRLSNSSNGSNFQNTVFLITFDEHGGCYDHVPPPVAVPPDPGNQGQMGFRFDRLGVRVPAILVSAYTQRGTIINNPMHHNSVMKTLCAKWDLGSFNDRLRTAPDFLEALNGTSIRNAADWPVITPRKMPEEMEEQALGDQPLNGLQKDILGLATVLAGSSEESVKGAHTVHEAIEFMKNSVGKNSL